MFKDPLSVCGRIRRTEFILTQIFYAIVYFFVLIFEKNKSVDRWIEMTMLLPMYPVISRSAKRCHDLDKSGLYKLVPFSALVMFFSAGNFDSYRHT